MSRSWGRRRPDGRRERTPRGQVEPLAALVAVVAVCLGLSVYAGVLDAELPGRTDRAVDEAALERVETAVAPAGVARPRRIRRGPAAGPDGYGTNVTLTAADRRWTAGPAIPPDADAAVASIGVRVSPGRVRPGRLEVRVR